MLWICKLNLFLMLTFLKSTGTTTVYIFDSRHFVQYDKVLEVKLPVSRHENILLDSKTYSIFSSKIYSDISQLSIYLPDPKHE